MTEETYWTVGQVATEVGVTVRTLHHYDDIGLVRPSARSHADYRLYTADDLRRLHHVMIYRRLGFGLGEIAALLEQDADLAAHLRRQRASVLERVAELEQLVRLIDHTLEDTMNNFAISNDEMKQIFGDAFDDSYQDEARARWGDTDAWRESAERTSQYSVEDWQQIKAENDAITARFAALMAAGVSADAPEAMDVAEQHRQHMTQRYFTCSRELHAQISELNVTDDRYALLYENVAPGLARYVRDASVANAAR